MKIIKRKTKMMKLVEHIQGQPIEEVLRIKFVDENKSIEQVGVEIGITYATTIFWLRLAGIYGRRIKMEVV